MTTNRTTAPRRTTTRRTGSEQPPAAKPDSATEPGRTAITRLQRLVVDALEDIKAQDIQVYDTTGLSDLFDRVVVASATSNRQTRALAGHLRDQVKEKGYDVVSVEGEDGGEWVLVDLGDIIVHIMQPAIRAYYNLEELWGGKPVRMRINGVTRTAPSIRPPRAAPSVRPPRAEPVRRRVVG